MKLKIEADLSRFVPGEAYALSRDIPNPKHDRRKRGGSDLDAYGVLPRGLRFVFDLIEHREWPMGDDTVVVMRRLHVWKCVSDKAHQWLRLEAHDVTREVAGKPTSREVFVTPVADFSPELHRVALAAIESMIPEAATLDVLADRAAEFDHSGWDVIADLIARGLVSFANIETSTSTLIEATRAERAANVREHEDKRERPKRET